MKKITKLLFFFSLMMIFHFGNLNADGRYLQQDESKSIRAREYVKKRPPAPKTTGTKPYIATSINSQPNLPKERSYRFVKTKKADKKGTKKPPVKTMEKAALGFTLWRLQNVADGDEPKGLTEINTQGKRQRPERLEAETMLPVGEMLRIGIESLSHNGYLYIINREKFADGTYGVAKLVFPTLGSRGGNNFVRAGVLTFVPAPPNAFQITTNTERKQTAEEITILVSPKPLIDAALLQENAITVSTDRLMEWVKLWETDEVQRELDGGVGQTMTLAEQTAGRDQSKGLTEVTPSLTQDDPSPQTVFDMKIKRGNPFLTRVTLEIKPD